MRINDILVHNNLGTLKFYDMLHAYGVTNTGKRVWLPHVIENKYWTNVVLADDDVIVQFGKSKKPRQKKLIWDSAVVITRDKKHGNYPNNLGTYRPVYRCMNGAITVHAKETLPIAQGTPPNDNDGYVSGFAPNAAAAREKAESYINKAKAMPKA